MIMSRAWHPLASALRRAGCTQPAGSPSSKGPSSQQHQPGFTSGPDSFASSRPQVLALGPHGASRLPGLGPALGTAHPGQLCPAPSRAETLPLGHFAPNLSSLDLC